MGSKARIRPAATQELPYRVIDVADVDRFVVQARRAIRQAQRIIKRYGKTQQTLRLVASTTALGNSLRLAKELSSPDWRRGGRR